MEKFSTEDFLSAFEKELKTSYGQALCCLFETGKIRAEFYTKRTVSPEEIRKFIVNAVKKQNVEIDAHMNAKVPSAVCLKNFEWLHYTIVKIGGNPCRYVVLVTRTQNKKLMNQMRKK